MHNPFAICQLLSVLACWRQPIILLCAEHTGDSCGSMQEHKAADIVCMGPCIIHEQKGSSLPLQVKGDSQAAQSRASFQRQKLGKNLSREQCVNFEQVGSGFDLMATNNHQAARSHASMQKHRSQVLSLRPAAVLGEHPDLIQTLPREGGGGVHFRRLRGRFRKYSL